MWSISFNVHLHIDTTSSVLTSRIKASSDFNKLDVRQPMRCILKIHVRCSQFSYQKNQSNNLGLSENRVWFISKFLTKMVIDCVLNSLTYIYIYIIYIYHIYILYMYSHPISSYQISLFISNWTKWYFTRKSKGTNIWLVVDLPLWKIWKSVGIMKFPIYGKVKNASNHQPDMIL